MILKMLDNENYYNENGDLNISKITSELNTNKSTVMSVLNGKRRVVCNFLRCKTTLIFLEIFIVLNVDYKLKLESSYTHTRF
jgi:hypothetical protein